VLAACGKAKFFAGVRAKFQHPIGQALRVKQFARLGIFGIRVAGICLVETAQRGLEFLRVARLKRFRHAGNF
jgi:hypothetical protein